MLKRPVDSIPIFILDKLSEYEDKIFLKVVKPSKEFRKENFVSIIFLEESKIYQLCLFLATSITTKS